MKSGTAAWGCRQTQHITVLYVFPVNRLVTFQKKYFTDFKYPHATEGDVNKSHSSNALALERT
jgi:hypothetical protein